MSEVKKDAPAAKEGEVTPKEPVGAIVDSGKDKQIAEDQRKRAEKAEREKADAESRATQLQEEITKLKTAGAMGDKSIGQVNDEIKRLAKEHNVDETFLAGLVSTVRAATKQEIREEMEKDFSPKLAKIENERSQEKMTQKFNELYDNTLKEMPEFKGIVNKEVIKSLAFNPENAKKTLPEIMEEAYGAAVTGKKSMETSKGGREPEVPNTKSPSKEDWDKIESDPRAKEEWSKNTEAQIKQYL